MGKEDVLVRNGPCAPLMPSLVQQGTFIRYHSIPTEKAFKRLQLISGVVTQGPLSAATLPPVLTDDRTTRRDVTPLEERVLSRLRDARVSDGVV
ncbi:hypothetical protein AAFF_G00237390 [Aldrovandia affinis]|uniref:Uncharacterized protein n=1 Tax=Aldrovandia affinis TaxID=143900 RepID=A0AAD7RF08_9TELE|nr:hypothetical protein AAFF_G00237390 [Aldrovandia affinis]